MGQVKRIAEAGQENPWKAAQVLTSVAHGFQRRMALKVVSEYADAIRLIAPEKLEVLIKNNVPLAPLLDRVGVAEKENVLGQLLRLDPQVMIDVLCQVHPALAPVLNTPQGLAWLTRQRSALRKVGD